VPYYQSDNIMSKSNIEVDLEITTIHQMAARILESKYSQSMADDLLSTMPTQTAETFTHMLLDEEYHSFDGNVTYDDLIQIIIKHYGDEGIIDFNGLIESSDGDIIEGFFSVFISEFVNTALEKAIEVETKN